MAAQFELQGHRGARGLKPENTLPSFEVALDLHVSSIETDVHLTRDGVPVLLHDPVLSPTLLVLTAPGAAPEPDTRPLVRTLTLAQLRHYRADRNPDPARFPEQDATAPPLARWFAEQHGLDPYTPPTLADLFQFVADYAGPAGEQAGKTPLQRQRAACLRFDLELKRVPFCPATIGDDFDGQQAGLLERSVLAAVHQAGVLDRATVRSFDHRCVRALKRLEPSLLTGVLIADTAPINPGLLARQAEASFYCPGYQFVDAELIRAAHAEGVRVLPWTVNDPDAWQRLLDWQVDGITTDYPDRLAALLRERGIAF